MKKGLTEIVFILDKSGSMSGLEADTIGGYNAFIEKQRKAEGEAYVSTVLFSDGSEVVHDRCQIEKIEPMNDRQYSVGGCTALLDAIGDSIKHIRNVHKYVREEDVPEKTIFVITTDGQENSSRKYDYNDVQKLINKQKEKSGWEFLFLGANIDAIKEASKIGICAERAVTYKCDSVGTILNFGEVSNAICEVRLGNKISKAWKRNIEEYEKTK